MELEPLLIPLSASEWVLVAIFGLGTGASLASHNSFRAARFPRASLLAGMTLAAGCVVMMLGAIDRMRCTLGAEAPTTAMFPGPHELVIAFAMAECWRGQLLGVFGGGTLVMIAIVLMVRLLSHAFATRAP